MPCIPRHRLPMRFWGESDPRRPNHGSRDAGPSSSTRSLSNLNSRGHKTGLQRSPGNGGRGKLSGAMQRANEQPENIGLPTRQSYRSIDRYCRWNHNLAGGWNHIFAEICLNFSISCPFRAPAWKHIFAVSKKRKHNFATPISLQIRLPIQQVSNCWCKMSKYYEFQIMRYRLVCPKPKLKSPACVLRTKS